MKKLCVIFFLLGLSVITHAGDVKRGEKLFVRCAICHGFNGEKSALNMSMIIRDMSRFDFIDAIKGYQNGTYGRDAKNQMIMAIKGLNDIDVDDLSSYVETLGQSK